MERKGLFTKEQEQILDELIRLKGIPEKVDLIVIRLIDDKGIELLLRGLNPGTKELIFGIIDMIFDGLKEVVVHKES